MQLLHIPTGSRNGARGAERCADEVMGALPPVIWFMRGRMRRNRGRLTMSQFRSLVRVEREESVSVTDIADHVGTSLSTTSRVVDGLVARGFLARTTSKIDRRRVNVSITGKGRAVLKAARSATRQELTRVFASLGEREHATLHEAMEILRRLFPFPGREIPSSEPGTNGRNGRHAIRNSRQSREKISASRQG